ncbi:MAG: hypothetical protein QXP70_05615 [Methanomassiliicoccales archaeon]
MNLLNINFNSIFLGPFTQFLRASLSTVFKAVVPAMSDSTNLFSSGIYSVWSSVLFLSEALLSIAVILCAYTYFSGVPLRGWRGNEAGLTRLVISSLAMPFTLYLGQLTLNVNDAMVRFILPYSQLNTYSTQIAQNLGSYSLGSLIIMAIVVLLIYLLLIVRMLLVFFLASLLPVACLCYSIEHFHNFGVKLISLFLEVAFLPFFMAVAFRIGIAVSSSSFHTQLIPPLLIAGTYLLPLIVPALISPTGQRVMQYMGIPAVSAVTSAGFGLMVSGSAYAAGLASFPLRRAILRGGSADEAGVKPSGRGVTRAFTTGAYHSSRIVTGVANLSDNIAARLPQRDRFHKPKKWEEFRPELTHHKIYRPREEE